jgi:hypothetical protein
MGFVMLRVQASMRVVRVAAMMGGAGLAAIAGLASDARAQGGEQPREAGRGQDGRRQDWRGQGGGMMRGLMGGQWAQPPALREADVRSALQDALPGMPLSDEQTQAIATLVRSYDERVDANERKARDARRAAMEKFRETRDASVWEGVREQQERNAREQREMEATLLADVRTTLSAEQDAQWSAIEAGVMRSRSLRRGLLSGERVSLRGVLREVVGVVGGEESRGKLTPEATQQLADTLAAYETQLDSALRARDAMLSESARVGEAMRTGDIAGATRQLELAEEAARNVASVNERFAGAVRGLLPEATREAFDAGLRKSRYPEAYRKTGMQEALDAALDLHDLTEEQRASLAGIVQRFDARYAGLRDRAIAARADAEANMRVADVVARFAGGGRGDNDRWGAVEAVFDERRSVDRELRQELSSVLNAEQAGIVLPQQGEGRRGREGGGQGGGQGRERANPPV